MTSGSAASLCRVSQSIILWQLWSNGPNMTPKQRVGRGTLFVLSHHLSLICNSPGRPGPTLHGAVSHPPIMSTHTQILRPPRPVFQSYRKLFTRKIADTLLKSYLSFSRKKNDDDTNMMNWVPAFLFFSPAFLLSCTYFRNKKFFCLWTAKLDIKPPWLS